MSEDGYKGEIKAKVVEVSFASSGLVSVVSKKVGDVVAKGNLLASLDKKVLQQQLDSELLDYEKVRADFDAFGIKTGEPTDDINRFLKKQKQASLDLSVKSVEISKARLDQADLFSPVNGVVIDDSNIVAGIYVSPASNPFRILDSASIYFEFEIDQKELAKFRETVNMEISFLGIEEKYMGKTRAILPCFGKKNGKFSVLVDLEKTEKLLMGMVGSAIIKI